MRKDLYEQGLVIGESKIHLKTDLRRAIAEAIREIRRHRRELVDYVAKHPEFQSALKPMEASAEAPVIVRIMTESSKLAEVGPMASVAGALADLGLQAMLKIGAMTAIAEDGGEIAAFTRRPISISILSSSKSLSGKIGFRIEREDCPTGIATSSSKTGHAISFGEADSVSVVAANAAVADAAATAVCNSVVGGNIGKSIELGLNRAKTIEGVRGVIIIREDRAGIWGKLPEIIRVK